MRRPALVLACWAALAGGLAARAGAQITGAMNARADILYPPLTGVGIRPLNFGVVIPGTPVPPVLPNTPRGGEFRITGTNNRKSINITFTLPTVLTGPAVLVAAGALAEEWLGA